MSTATFVTPPTLAKRLGVSENKIIGAIDRGELEAHDLSERQAKRPRYRISEEAINRWLRSRSTVANRAPEPAPRHRRRSTASVPNYV